MNVYLIGYRGTGKSTVAPHVATLLSVGRKQRWHAIDLDHRIERDAGQSIAAIFQNEGEAGFRRRESRALAQVAAESEHIVATGGGVILLEANREQLRQGFVVWLTASPETIWRRVQQDPATNDRRPNLSSQGGLAEIQDLLEHRTPLYQSLANQTLSTEDTDPARIAEAIAAEFQDWLARGGR